MVWCKFLFLLFLPAALSLSEEMQELADMLHSTCQGETGVPEDMILNARKGDFADDERLKCYMKCIFVQMAILGDDGTIDSEAAAALIPEDLPASVADTIRKCGTVAGADDCDTSWLTNKCYYENNPDNFFLV